MINRTAMDHLAEAIVLTGQAEGAAARGDVAKAEELDFEADFELDLLEDLRLEQDG